MLATITECYNLSAFRALPCSWTRYCLATMASEQSANAYYVIFTGNKCIILVLRVCHHLQREDTTGSYTAAEGGLYQCLLRPSSGAHRIPQGSDAALRRPQRLRGPASLRAGTTPHRSQLLCVLYGSVCRLTS